MAFQSLQSLFTHEVVPLSEDDIRRFIEQWLKRELKSDAIICQGLYKGKAEVRVGSPTLQQEVLLAEYDLKAAVKKEGNYELLGLKVVRG